MACFARVGVTLCALTLLASCGGSGGSSNTPSGDGIPPKVDSVVPSDGLATTTTKVMITGTGFDAAANVTVGGTGATCTVVDAMTMNCAFGNNGGVPAMVDVVVENPGGLSGTATNGFTHTGVLADTGADFWCVIQIPASTTTTAGVPTATIYGQIYVAGSTDAEVVAVSTILGALGYGADGADPTAVDFTWGASVPNAGYDFFGNNDEHQATMVVAAGGTYDYAYRFSLDGGVNYTYCDTNGSDDGYAPENAGNLTVN